MSKRDKQQSSKNSKKLKVDEFDEEVDRSFKLMEREQSSSNESETKSKYSKKKVTQKKRAKVESSESDNESSDYERKVKKSKSKKKAKESSASDDKSSDYEREVKKSKPKKKAKESAPKASTSKKELKNKSKVVHDPDHLPTVKRVSAKKGAPSEDPSTNEPTETNKFPVVYKGKTYYTNYLPKNFQTVWDRICEMRESGIAANADIDTMGYKTFANDQNFDEKARRYHTFVALQISSQTEDKQIFKAMENLKSYGLTPENMAKISADKLTPMIKNVSFHPKKVGLIQDAAKIIISNYGGDVPRNKHDLMALPGIGDKTAALATEAIWREITGVSIDTNLNRVLPRLGWVSEEKNRDKQKKEIESWMPKAMWGDLHDKLKGFGQSVCLTLIQSKSANKGPSKAPRCEECTVSEFCKFYAEQF